MFLRVAPILKQLGSLFIPEKNSPAILYDKHPDSCKEMQMIINKMAQDYQTLAMRNDFLENENSELRRKISTWTALKPETHEIKITLDNKSKENARLLEQKKNMQVEIKNQENTIKFLHQEININYKIIIEEAKKTIFDLRAKIEKQKIELDERKILNSDLEKDLMERQGIRLYNFKGNIFLLTVTYRLFITFSYLIREDNIIDLENNIIDLVAENSNFLSELNELRQNI